MRKTVAVLLLVVVALLAVGPTHASAWGGGWRGHGGHTRVFVGFGPSFWWGPYPWYYPPYVVAAPPVVVQQEPPEYIQQEPAPAAVAAPESYWYYCESARGYYPNVSSCPEAWIRVAPRAQ